MECIPEGDNVLRKNYQSAVNMYNGGLSIAKVAKRFRITRQAMFKALRRRGVKFRSKSLYGEANNFYRGTRASPRVHDITEAAIKRGDLIPELCQVCGNDGKFQDGRREVQSHHDNYNEPLEVTWLCQKCHFRWHVKNKAIPEIEQKKPLK